MNKIYPAVITGAVLMTAAGMANGQGTGTSSTSGTASNLCWDVGSSLIREKDNLADTSSTVGSDTSSTVGSALPSADLTSVRNSMGTGIARPAGMPDC